jgi:hypothetical protein
MQYFLNLWFQSFPNFKYHDKKNNSILTIGIHVNDPNTMPESEKRAFK